MTHAPALHDWAIAQAVPHMPQFAGSDCVLVQRPPHTVCPVAQPQAPALHAAPPLHAMPHAPQWSASVCVFTQRPPQSV